MFSIQEVIVRSRKVADQRNDPLWHLFRVFTFYIVFNCSLLCCLLHCVDNNWSKSQCNHQQFICNAALKQIGSLSSRLASRLMVCRRLIRIVFRKNKPSKKSSSAILNVINTEWWNQSENMIKKKDAAYI